MKRINLNLAKKYNNANRTWKGSPISPLPTLKFVSRECRDLEESVCYIHTLVQRNSDHFPWHSLEVPIRNVEKNFCSALNSNLISQQSYQELRNTVSQVVCKTIEDFDPSLPADAKGKLKRLTEDSLNKDLFQGALALLAYEQLEKPERVTKDSLIKMRVLGWGANTVNSCVGKLEKNCYHSEENADDAKDGSLLRSLVYEVLKKNCVADATLKDVLDMFDKAFLYSSIGTYLDNLTSNPKDFNAFTSNRYNDIVDFKSYSAFKLPVHLAMNVANKVDKYSILRVNGVCTDIGRLAQLQNDFLNCYGNVDITGPNSDIRNGRCTWLALTALQRCNPAQRKVFAVCYGSAEPAHIERVKRLYDQLQVAQLFGEQQKLLKNGIAMKAQGLANANIPPEIFMRLLGELLVE